MWKVVVALAVILCVTGAYGQSPLWKVFCAGLPLFRGRVDPIVSPGLVSNHVHRVAGASKFSPATATATPVEVYNSIKSSKCSTCSLPVVDNSAYWHPDLFYKWPNGTLSLVPSGGLTVYYLSRRGSGSQANPKWTAFPPGFRMTAGNPFRRSYNSSNPADNAINFACLPETGNLPETNGFPTPDKYCKNGLRAQVFFPMCWNGKDLDTPNHQAHMAYPSGVNTGDCPAGFTTRVPGVFFEAFYSVSQFPLQSYQPFVLACGDNTGYGFHGDFLNGWDATIMQRALEDVTCYSNSTNEGNNVKACNTLKSFVTETSNGACQLENKIPLTEAVGTLYGIPRLPGCQTITGPQSTMAPICTSAPNTSFSHPASQRFILVAKTSGKVVSAPDNKASVLVAKATTAPTLNEVFSTVAWAAGTKKGVAILVEAYAGYGIPGSYCGASGANGNVICDKNSPSSSDTSWEAFFVEAQSGGYIAIKSNYNNKYWTVQSDGTIGSTSSTVGDAQLFTQQVPNGGAINAVVY